MTSARGVRIAHHKIVTKTLTNSAAEAFNLRVVVMIDTNDATSQRTLYSVRSKFPLSQRTSLCGGGVITQPVPHATVWVPILRSPEYFQFISRPLLTTFASVKVLKVSTKSRGCGVHPGSLFLKEPAGGEASLKLRTRG